MRKSGFQSKWASDFSLDVLVLIWKAFWRGHLQFRLPLFIGSLSTFGSAARPSRLGSEWPRASSPQVDLSKMCLQSFPCFPLLKPWISWGLTNPPALESRIKLLSDESTSIRETSAGLLHALVAGDVRAWQQINWTWVSYQNVVHKCEELPIALLDLM